MEFLGKELNGLRVGSLPHTPNNQYTFRVSEVYRCPNDLRYITTNYRVKIPRSNVIFTGNDRRGYTMSLIPHTFKFIEDRAKRFGAIEVKVYPLFTFWE